MKTALRRMALRDALQSARMHLAEEIAAVAFCVARGDTDANSFDLVVARREVVGLTELVARLEARAAVEL